MSFSRFYVYLTSIYRLGIIAIVIIMDILAGFNYQKEKLFIYVFLGLYAVIFSIFRINKWIAYLELLGVVGLLYFFNEPILHFLFIIPFTNFVSSEAKKMDILVFWFISSTYVYYMTDNLMLSMVISVGVLSSLYIFHQKFNQIEKISNQLFKAKEEIKEAREEITTHQAGFEITLKMFYYMRELSEAENEEQVFKMMLHGSNSFFSAMYSCFYMKDEDGMYFAKTLEEGNNQRFEVPNNLDDTPENKEAIFNNQMMRMPIVVNGEEFGIVSIYGKRMAIGEKGQMVISPFSESDFEHMLTYIYSVTKRITELQISQQNLFLANNDFLTKVPNRRYFWEQLDRMVDLAQRGEDFAVLVMDIDNFKSFNDTYGHQMGDSVLKIVAETVEDAIRKADIVGRIGGEEFGVILYKPKNEAMMVAERIRRLVAAVPGPPRQITLSIGLAYFGKHGDTVEELMKNADAAMYEAKQTGKNKVVEYHAGLDMNDY